jgi:hypothetical protein
MKGHPRKKGRTHTKFIGGALSKFNREMPLNCSNNYFSMRYGKLRFGLRLREESERERERRKR